MTREKTWREKTIDSLRWDYGLYAELWEKENDDRKLFSNMYYQMVEAVEELPPEPCAWTCVAIHNKMDEAAETMLEIIDKYCHGLWGEPVVIHFADKAKRWPDILKQKVRV